MSERIIERTSVEMYEEDQSKYSIIVNRRRAIPSVQDGLKPVYRRILYTAFEIGSILILVLTIYLIDSHPYWSMTIGWIFPISLIIFSFSFNKGYISKLISNSFFVFLGSLTFEAYLLHEVVDRYFYIIPNINNALTYERILLYFTYILVVTFLLSYIFHFYFNNKKAKKTR